jgi:hypothetical protein
VLFYTTEGNFGEDNFKIICEELFPLDIGSSSYTEYETDDPDFIKFMMSNPAILEMKKGHCHSHNTMTTFFSGTDTGELVENAPNHNIYVSLIVNNRNDNCAMVAFVASEVTTIPASTISTEVKFRDQDGNEVVRKYKREVAATEKEGQVVYAHDCEIEYPGMVGDTLTARFQQLSDNLRKKEEARQENLKKDYYQNPRDSWRKDPFYGKRGWNQPDLFDTNKGADRDNTNKEKGKKSGREIYIPPGISGKHLLKEIENGDKVYNKNKQRGGAYTQLPKSTKTEIYSMLSKLLTLDPMSEEHLASIVKRTSDEFYPTGTRDIDLKTKANHYYDAITERAKSFYSISFNEDKRRTKYEDTMSSAIEILETFDSHFPEFIDQVITAIKETFNESFNKESKLFS